MKKILVLGISMVSLCFVLPAQASYLEVLDTIRATGHTIQTVNSTLKNTTGTIEHTQRFGDRQGARQERKRDKINAEADMERAYYEAQSDLYRNDL